MPTVLPLAALQFLPLWLWVQRRMRASRLALVMEPVLRLQPAAASVMQPHQREQAPVQAMQQVRRQMELQCLLQQARQ